MTHDLGPSPPGLPLSNPGPAFVTLLTVFTFTQAQSLYEMLAGNRELLALRLESNWQLVEIVLAFNLLPVLVLFGLWWAVSRIHPSAARVFLALVCFPAFVTFFFQLDNAYFLSYWKGFSHSYWLWVVLALTLAVMLLRFEKLAYTFVLVLSPVVLLFPLLFLARTWADTRTYIPASVAAAQSSETAAVNRVLPPIAILVLDELSLPALLDETGQIDSRRYPNFQALAQQSHWFRNATANADHTTRSIPALITGNLALPKGSPSYRVYPENLFTWLEPHYRIYVGETWTHFRVPGAFQCLGALHEDTANRADLFRDLLALYAHRVRPGGINTGYQAWARTWALLRDPHRLMPLRLSHFERLLQSVDSLVPQAPFLLFYHYDLPHSPYWLSPEGKVQETGPAEFDPSMAGDAEIVSDVFARYRRQIMYVDHCLGRLVAELKARSLYEESLIVLVSDHGVSYRAEAPGRNLMEQGGRIVNADLLLSVPLLIKLPHQREGRVSDREVQLIDLLPTLADVLGLEIPWQVAGRSVFSQAETPRLKIALDREGHRHEFPDDLGLRALGYRLPEVTVSRGQPEPAY